MNAPPCFYMSLPVAGAVALAVVARGDQRRLVVFSIERSASIPLSFPPFPYQKRLPATRVNIGGNQRTCSDFSLGGCSDSLVFPRNGSNLGSNPSEAAT